MNLPKIKKSNTDITRLNLFLKGEPGFGKTSLFHYVAKHKFNDPEEALLILCGAEAGGDEYLTDSYSIHVSTWAELKQLTHWLLTEEFITKDTNGKKVVEKVPHQIKMICFDTAGELCKLAETETIRVNNTSGIYKQCHSIKGAMGGYMAGYDYVISDLLTPLFNKLKAKFGVWVTAHTDYKKVKHRSGIDREYYQLVSDLYEKYDIFFSSKFSVSFTGVIEKGLNKVGTDSSGNDIKVATKEDRVLYTRGTEEIASKSHFNSEDFPAKILFDKLDMGQEFIDIMEKAMKDSQNISKNPSHNVSAPVAKPEPIIEEEPVFNPIEVEDVVEVEEVGDTPTTQLSKDEMIAEVKKVIAVDQDKKVAVQAYVKQHGRISELTDHQVKELYGLIG